MTDRIRPIVRRLERRYGPRPPQRHGDALAGLVQTILSQHTSDANSDAAYASLRRAFPDWHACMTAAPARVERAIRSGGLARAKARAIQAVLRRIQEDRGRLSLEFLRRWPLERAREYLLSMSGVGPKTAACVLLFNLGKPALPVDTHVHRVSTRLGLLPEGTTAEAAHGILEPACPPAQVYPFHVLLIRLGRRACRARRPRCDACPLNDMCPSAFAAERETTAASPSSRQRRAGVGRTRSAARRRRASTAG